MVSSDPTISVRRIRFEGVRNFRDLGGYRTRDGRRVRWERVYRSDGLDLMTPGDVRHACDALGIASTIDLRSYDELERYGPGPLTDVGIPHHHLPLFDRLPEVGGARERPLPPLPEWYLTMLRVAAHRFVAVLELLAEERNHPTVFFCSAGKDRTGLVTALLLGTLGVDEHSIVADYALTPKPQRGARPRRPGFEALLGRELPPAYREADPATMRSLLEAIDGEFGSLRAYVELHANDGSLVGALERALLVEDAP